MRSTLVVALLSLSLAYAAPADAAEWSIDGTHSTVGFKVRHMMVSWVRGTFGKVSGEIHIDHDKLAESSAVVTVEAASVDTANEKRDKHLRNSDFFDVEKYPTITFKSTSVRNVGADSFEFVGDLTLLGTTREVVVSVTDVAKPIQGRRGKKSGASASFEINRSDFGMTYSRVLDAGGLNIGTEVKLSIDMELNEVKK